MAGKALVMGVAGKLGGDLAPVFTNQIFWTKMIYFAFNASVYFIYTPARRAKISSFLTSMVVNDEVKSAASVAALLGNAKASDSLALARDKFVSINFDQLIEEDFDKNKEDENRKNELHDKTERTNLGECDVFLSHSWHDNGRKKYAALHAWAEKFKKKKGRDPKLWLDKACIDQTDIANDLLCLPIFLAGCENLLIIAGPTYTERLWCLMEVFVFLQMGGSIERITVIAIDVTDEQAKTSFEKADINKCKCHLERDRKKLLGIVQQGFGNFDAFNDIIRHVFNERMFKERIPVEEKVSALAHHNHILYEKLEKHTKMIEDQAKQLEEQSKLIEALTKAVLKPSRDEFVSIEMMELKRLAQSQHEKSN